VFYAFIHNTHWFVTMYYSTVYNKLKLKFLLIKWILNSGWSHLRNIVLKSLVILGYITILKKCIKKSLHGLNENIILKKSIALSLYIMHTNFRNLGLHFCVQTMFFTFYFLNGHFHNKKYEVGIKIQVLMEVKN